MIVGNDAVIVQEFASKPVIFVSGAALRAQAILKLSSVQKNGQVNQINLLSRYDNSLTANTPK